MPRTLFQIAIVLAFCASATCQAAAPARSGEQIYRQLCNSCHGPLGEGSADYPHPLAGDRSIVELADLISRTMPEGEPEKCVGEDARQVALYISEKFYSPAAQARLKPPRLELSRLTVRQYRETLADLIGSFRNDKTTYNGDRGLWGQYFNARRFDKKLRIIERLDPQVQFDFGDKSPEPEKIANDEFFIHWSGSLLAPETGVYDIIVKTDNGTRLWLNDPRKPLIDAGVKSGNDQEYRESIYLLGGRAYPLRIEFFKSKKSNEKTSSVALMWQRPHGVAETIPPWQLAPQSGAELFLCDTPFPPDDRNQGYERGASISKAWDQATTDGAIVTANYVLTQLNSLANTKDDAPDRAKKLQDFCKRFVERAFRRPLSSEVEQRFITRQFDENKDLNTAVKRVVLLALKSPRFLFREIDGAPNDPYNVASRMSFGMWDSSPDTQLHEAAARGQLQTRQQLVAQAERMSNDLRTRAKLREFLLQWFQVDRHPEISKDPRLFPEFDQSLVSDLRTSFDLTINDVVNDSAADLRKLLTNDEVYLNARLAKFYGVELPDGESFQKIAFEPQSRRGVLSHPYLLSALAYTGTSSPIHRGVFISRSVLGRSLRPPPEAVSPLAPDLHPSLSTRERVTLQTQSQACQSCHVMINSLGFALESFDAVGKRREKEKNKPVDTHGSYINREGEQVRFHGAGELAQFLAESSETHAAFAEQLFQYLVKQPAGAYGPATLAGLERSFVTEKLNLRRLMVEIIVTSALTPTRTGS